MPQKVPLQEEADDARRWDIRDPNSIALQCLLTLERWVFGPGLPFLAPTLLLVLR